MRLSKKDIGKYFYIAHKRDIKYRDKDPNHFWNNLAKKVKLINIINRCLVFDPNLAYYQVVCSLEDGKKEIKNLKDTIAIIKDFLEENSIKASIYNSQIFISPAQFLKTISLKNKLNVK